MGSALESGRSQSNKQIGAWRLPTFYRLIGRINLFLRQAMLFTHDREVFPGHEVFKSAQHA